MKRKNYFIAYLLIGIGIYFLIKQLELPFFEPLVGWPTLLGIVGTSFLLHSYKTKNKQNIFIGVLLVGFSIHFNGIEYYSFWYDHWAVYTLIVGIAYLISFFSTKKGLVLAVVLISISIIMLFSITLPDWVKPIYGIIDFIETFWPIILIVLGIYFLRTKRME